MKPTIAQLQAQIDILVTNNITAQTIIARLEAKLEETEKRLDKANAWSAIATQRLEKLETRSKAAALNYLRTKDQSSVKQH